MAIKFNSKTRTFEEEKDTTSLPLTSKIISKIAESPLELAKKAFKAPGEAYVKFIDKKDEAQKDMTLGQKFFDDIIKTPVKIISSFTKPIVQAPLAALTKIGLSDIEAVTGQKQNIELGETGKAIFGTDKLKSVQESFKTGQEAVSKFGGSKLESVIYPVAGIVGGIFMDLYTGGKSKSVADNIISDKFIRDTIETLAKDTDPVAIEQKLYKVFQGNEAEMKALSQKLSSVKDPIDVAETIDKARVVSESKNDLGNIFYADVNDSKGFGTKNVQGLLDSNKDVARLRLKQDAVEGVDFRRVQDGIEILNKEAVEAIEPVFVNRKVVDGQAFDPMKYVNEQVAKQEAARKAETGGKSRLKEMIEDFETKFIDFTMPLTRTLNQSLKKNKMSLLPEADLDSQIDRVFRAKELATQFVKDNNFDQIVKKSDDAFEQYLIARHAVDVDTRGFATGRDLAKDEALVRALAPRFEADAQAVTDYSQKILQKAIDDGLINAELGTKLREIYPNYVPIKRIFNELEQPNSIFNSKGIANISTQSVVQALKGSEREIESPLESLLLKTYDTFYQGEKNRAAQILTSFIDLPGNPFGLRALRTEDQVKQRISIFTEMKELRPIQNQLNRFIKTDSGYVRKLQTEINRLNKEGLKTFFKQEDKEALESLVSGIRETKQGLVDIPAKLKNRQTKKFIDALISDPNLDIKRIKSKIATRENKLGPILDRLEVLKQEFTDIKNQRRDLFDVGRSLADQKKESTEEIISVFRNGVKEMYAAPREIAEAAKALNLQQLSIMGRIAATPVRVARLGITGLNPAFILSNLARDQVTRIINSNLTLRQSLLNPKVFIEALTGAVGHGKIYQDWIRAGGGGTSFDLSREGVRLTKEALKSKTATGKAKFLVKNPGQLLRALENIASRTEEFTRLQEFSGQRQKFLKLGYPLKDAEAMAAKASREATANFARRGAYGPQMNAAILYLNAGIQGSRALVRAWNRNPVQTSAKIMATIMLPAAYFTFNNLSDPKKKEAYDDIADFEKENNFIIIPDEPVKNADGTWEGVIKIPITPGLANLANLTRQSIEELHGIDSMSFKETFDQMVGVVSPIAPNVKSFGQLIPQAIKPTIEGIANYSFFKERAIVGQAQERLSPEMQVKESTSGVARKLGKLFGLSPIKTDEWLKSTFGGLSQNVIHEIDTLLSAAGQLPKGQIGGKSILESISGRFAGAVGGAKDQEANTELAKILQKQNDERFQLKQQAEVLYKNWSELPKAEANKKLRELRKTDKALADKLVDVIAEEKKGLTYNDRLVLQLGVENGERADYIFAQWQTKSEEEQKAYIAELKKKKIISEQVRKQLNTLLREYKQKQP